MRFPWLSRALRSRSQTARRSRPPRRFRPAVEGLEDRSLLTTVYVVPIEQPIDATHRHSLTDAMPVAGAAGTVVVEPGSNPGFGTINVTLDGLTITGDASFPGGILPRYDVSVNAHGVTLNNLNLGTVTIAATASDAVITRSQVGNITEAGAATGVGHNLISHNVITGSVDLQGNSDLGQTTADLVAHNRFESLAPVMLKLTNSTGTTIRDNSFAGDASSQVGIQVRSNSDQVTIEDNRIELTGTGMPLALVLINTGGAAGNILGARVANNTLDAGPAGTGLYMNIFGSGSTFVAQVEGNEFHGNKVGVDINGITGFATGAGNIDLGGGSNGFGVSKGGNNFRGYDGVGGHFAIYLHNTDAGVGVVAHRNIFDGGINPGLVVKDGANGGGTGSVSVTSPLDADHAFVQNLLTRLAGRTGDPGPGGELDQWVAQLPKKGRRGVARAILFGTDSLRRIVDGIYTSRLGRSATLDESAKWVKQIQLGVSVAAVEAAVIGSAEFLRRINTDFVQAVYQQVLHRNAVETEVAKWYALLPSLGRRGVAAAIINSKENRIKMAAQYYRDLMHREATEPEATALATRSGSPLALKLWVLAGIESYEHG